MDSCNSNPNSVIMEGDFFVHTTGRAKKTYGFILFIFQVIMSYECIAGEKNTWWNSKSIRKKGEMK